MNASLLQLCASDRRCETGCDWYLVSHALTHTIRSCTQKAKRVVLLVCFRASLTQEGMKGGTWRGEEKVKKKKDASDDHWSTSARDDVSHLFFSFFGFFPKRNSWNKQNTRHGFSSQQEEKTQTRAHKTPQLCQQNLWTLLPISRD